MCVSRHTDRGDRARAGRPRGRARPAACGLPRPGRESIAPTADVFDSWAREFRGRYRRERCFVLTTHPQLIGRAGRVDALEELLQEVRATGDTWIATGSEIADFWRDRHG